MFSTTISGFSEAFFPHPWRGLDAKNDIIVRNFYFSQIRAMQECNPVLVLRAILNPETKRTEQAEGTEPNPLGQAYSV